jgi:hypothetical protein
MNKITKCILQNLPAFIILIFMIGVGIKMLIKYHLL